jgi:hypothetical protein
VPKKQGAPRNPSSAVINESMERRSGSARPIFESDVSETLRQQIQQFNQAGKYAQPVALQRRLAAQVERGEAASAAMPCDKNC